MFLLLLFMEKHTNGGMLPKGRIFGADTPDGKVGFEIPKLHTQAGILVKHRPWQAELILCNDWLRPQFSIPFLPDLSKHQRHAWVPAQIQSSWIRCPLWGSVSTHNALSRRWMGDRSAHSTCIVLVLCDQLLMDYISKQLRVVRLKAHCRAASLSTTILRGRPLMI